MHDAEQQVLFARFVSFEHLDLQGHSAKGNIVFCTSASLKQIFRHALVQNTAPHKRFLQLRIGSGEVEGAERLRQAHFGSPTNFHCGVRHDWGSAAEEWVDVSGHEWNRINQTLCFTTNKDLRNVTRVRNFEYPPQEDVGGVRRLRVTDAVQVDGYTEVSRCVRVVT